MTSKNKVYVENQGMQCAELLTEQYGYEPPWHPDSSGYTKVLNDQHAVVVNVGAKDYRSRGDVPVSLRVYFGLARRDINELVAQLDTDSPIFGQRPNWVYQAVFETTKDLFFEESMLRWAYHEPFDVARRQIEQALVKLENYDDLAHVEHELYKPPRPWDVYAFPRAANDALNGDDRGAELYERYREWVYDGPPEKKPAARFETFDANLQTFRDQFPNGIDRE